MCTATHDVSRRLIYEGDLLKTPDGVGVVYWNETSGYMVLMHKNNSGGSISQFFHDGQMEIVGNIHDPDAREKLDPSLHDLIDFFGGTVLCPE